MQYTIHTLQNPILTNKWMEQMKRLKMTHRFFQNIQDLTVNLEVFWLQDKTKVQIAWKFDKDLKNINLNGVMLLSAGFLKCWMIMGARWMKSSWCLAGLFWKFDLHHWTTSQLLTSQVVLCSSLLGLNVRKKNKHPLYNIYSYFSLTWWFFSNFPKPLQFL